MTRMPENFWSGWQERLSALRHVPPVLKIVWRSGPLVVTMGLVFRIFASLLPIALLLIPIVFSPVSREGPVVSASSACPL